MTTNIVCLTSTLKLLRIYQVFPAVGREFNPGITFYVKFALTCLLASTILVGSLMHFIYSLQNQLQIYIYKDMANVLTMAAAYSLFIIFHYNTGSAVKLFTFLSDFETFGKPPKFEERNQQLNRFSKYHYVYISLASFSFLSVTDIFVPNVCRKNNEQFNLDEVCGLATNIWLPVDIDFFPMKQMFAALQVFSIMYVYVTAGMTSWLTLEIVEHILVRIDHVKLLFSTSLSEQDPDKMKKDFRFAAKYHSRLLELENDFNQCFSLSMFMVMLLGAPILGCGSFGYMEARSNTALVIILSWFNALTILCIAGQRLINENMTVAETIYNANWYNADLSLRKDILIVLMRCQKPMKLRAAAFGVMNHSMIVIVSRAAYTYINLLRASSQKINN